MYKYVIPMEKSNLEIVKLYVRGDKELFDWLKINGCIKSDIIQPNPQDEQIVLTFNSKEDAMRFKLIWGGTNI